MSGKRAIPPVFRGGDLAPAVEALKLNMEIMMGQRVDKLQPLPSTATTADLIAAYNALLERLQ